MEFMAKSLAPLTAGATDLAINGDVEGGIQFFTEGIAELSPNLPPDIKEKVDEMAGPDHAWQKEEIANAKFMLGTWLEKEGGTRTGVSFLMDGKPERGSMDQAGNYFIGTGNEPALGKITPVAPGATQTELSGVNPSGVSKNTIAFQDSVIGAVGAVQTGTELLISSGTNPEALGVPGGFMRFGSNLVSGARAIADWAEYERLSVEETEKQTMGSSAFDYSKLDTDKLGVSGAEAEKFRAGVFGIAFAAAVAEQGTRPTDKDIQQFIDQVGGRATSAQSFRETIVQFMRRQDRRLKTIADVKQIGETDREAAFSAWKPAFRSFMEAYAEQSGRRTATNAETDEKFIEISPGKWEPF